MLDASELAQKLHDVLPQKTDKDGKPTAVSDSTKAYAAGVIAALKAAVLSNLPGTITGITSPGSPLSQGAGVGGILVMLPAPMISQVTAGFPPQAAAALSKEATALIGYLTTGIVVFAPGKVTGQCTNTPIAPGPLTNGAASGGMITGLTGSGALAMVAAALGGIGPNASAHYNAVVEYVTSKAEAAYATGTITGVCPPGGGPLVGLGAGGTIS